MVGVRSILNLQERLFTRGFNFVGLILLYLNMVVGRNESIFLRFRTLKTQENNKSI